MTQTTVQEIAQIMEELLKETVSVDYPHEYSMTSAQTLHDLTRGQYDYDAPVASAALTVRLGGYAGGNCWGGSAERYSEPGAHDLSFELLETFLETCVPDALFSDFRKLQPLVQEQIITHSEYYGNSTENIMYFLPLEPVAAFLNERGLAVQEPDLSLTARLG